MLKTWEFDFKICQKEQLTLDPGSYKLEVWGASGGSVDDNAHGGRGGYSTGVLILKERTEVFVHVGSQGSNETYGEGSEGCNGGGYSYSALISRAGGGATDIRLKNDSLFSRVIVAGGGGGSGDQQSEYGGYAGGLNAGDGSMDYVNRGKNGKGAGQFGETIECADGTLNTCPIGTFGFGGIATGNYAGGGGGGWYGGSASSYEGGAGGGSGYVFTSDSYKPKGFLLNEDYYLVNAKLFSGNQEFPKPDKTGNETGHIRNGYARISREYDLPPTSKSKNGFYFFANDDLIVKDEYGKFVFNTSSVYSTLVKPGAYLFYVNGTNCGQSILAEYEVKGSQKMTIFFYDSIKIIMNEKIILQSPSHESDLPTIIDSAMKVGHNYSMSSFACVPNSKPGLTISYHSLMRFTCKRKLKSAFTLNNLIYIILITK